MTPERRAQILAHIPTILCLDEMHGFRVGLSERGELADAEVMAAIRDRQDELHKAGARLKR